MTRYGELRGGEVFSVRLDAETAGEVRWAARESGTPISDVLRRGLRPVLAWIRAEWYEKHASEDDWEAVEAVATVQPRELKSSFGVALTGEQLMEIGKAAEACGVTISAYLREAGLALAAAHQAGGTARCQHVSMGSVTAAECGTCGPLRVTYTLPAPGVSTTF